MEALLERIEENRLDALYLFINEPLRDRSTFDRFIRNLLSVLPHNWSIQRVEVGHEFLSMMLPRQAQAQADADEQRRQQQQQQQMQEQQQEAAAAAAAGGAAQQPNRQPQRNQHEQNQLLQRRILIQQQQQQDLFQVICGLESLKTLIISDGYVPRKDDGSIPTDALLNALPLARNLTNLDLQRLGLRVKSSRTNANSASKRRMRRRMNRRRHMSFDDDDEFDDEDDSDLDVDSEEDIDSTTHNNDNNADGGPTNSNDRDQVQHLARVFESLQDSLEDIRLTGLFLIEEDDDKGTSSSTSATALTTTNASGKNEEDGLLDPVLQACVEMSNLKSLAISLKQDSQDSNDSASQGEQPRLRPFLSRTCLQDLCQNSTTLQDLSLRAMKLTNASCETLAHALTERRSCFLTSLDIRQNVLIGDEGYHQILRALERNCDLWCTVMVDNEQFQGKFNSLIELNQAGRGNLIHHPSRRKLTEFLQKLQEDPTAVWYFLTIHDTILFPLVRFLQWKHQVEEAKGQQQQQQQQLDSSKRKSEDETNPTDAKRPR